MADLRDTTPKPFNEDPDPAAEAISDVTIACRLVRASYDKAEQQDRPALATALDNLMMALSTARDDFEAAVVAANDDDNRNDASEWTADRRRLATAHRQATV